MVCLTARARGARLTVVAALVAGLLAAAGPAQAADRPRYDVPAGFTKCAGARAWNGFFKWASVHDASCRRAADFMRAYARAARDSPAMPRAVRGHRCAIREWRTAEGDIYATRHRCTRGTVVIRFYGMV